MIGYRKIDDVIDDASVCVTIGDASQLIDWSGIPEISDGVSLLTNKGYSMMVSVTKLSKDKSIFCGKVKQGYFPDNKEDWIDIGEMVKFSRKKIRGIHKK